MITRSVGRLWLVVGRLRRTANPDLPAHRHPGRWDARTVLLESAGYPSEDLCKEALLHGWSQAQHEAEVLSVTLTDPDHSIKLTA